MLGAFTDREHVRLYFSAPAEAPTTRGFAAILAAGLDGLKNKRDPGKRLDIDMYAEGHTVTNARRLPLNLLDALRAFDQSVVLREGLGDEFSSAYLKLKYEDWNKYTRHLTEWERETTLDC